MNGADIRAVVYALVEETINSLNEGHIVRLGDLGSLRITLSSEGKYTSEEVSANSIKDAGVIYTPGNKIKEILIAAKFTKE